MSLALATRFCAAETLLVISYRLTPTVSALEISCSSSYSFLHCHDAIMMLESASADDPFILFSGETFGSSGSIVPSVVILDLLRIGRMINLSS